jgi:hypothetical protein
MSERFIDPECELLGCRHLKTETEARIAVFELIEDLCGCTVRM